MLDQILIGALQGGDDFTKLDLLNAYNQLLLAERSKMLLAWKEHQGIYKVNWLPFGTKWVCSTIQK